MSEQQECENTPPARRRVPAHWEVCVSDFFSQPTLYRIDWLILASFVVTFIAARVMVFVIMAHWAPSILFLHVGGTHVHHLNYGIILLSVIGAYLLLGRPQGLMLALTALIYGIALGLTFDEFGMWLHLGGGYWQRTSFDAVVVIAACLGLIAAGPTIRRYRPHHWITTIGVGVAVLVFASTVYTAVNYAGGKIAVRLADLEKNGPP